MGTDYNHEVDAGRVDGTRSVRKFGRAPSGVQQTATDIWDRADAATLQQVWVAPTAARIHTIASTSAADTTGSTGANSVIISYLPDWDTQELTETVTGDLNAGIAMTASAVIIHRMKVVPQSTSTSINVGIITATAAVDGTVTAQINAGEGQTQMAIYGVSSLSKAFVDFWYGDINKASGVAAHINYSLLVNTAPDVVLPVFTVKSTRGVQSTGSSSPTKWDEPTIITGPCIIKVQGIASANDVEGSAGFKLKLEDL